VNPDSHTVGIGMLVVIAVGILYDIYLEGDNVKDNTYSEILRKWFTSMSWFYYGVSFGLGVLMAHWGIK